MVLSEDMCMHALETQKVEMLTNARANLAWMREKAYSFLMFR